MNLNRLLFLLVMIFFGGSIFFAWNNIKNDKLNLGLDLVGGSSLTLQADFDKYIKETNQTMIESLIKLMREKNMNYKSIGLSGQNIEITPIEVESSENHAKYEPLKILKEIVGDNFKTYYDHKKIIIAQQADYLKSLKSEIISEAIKNIQKRIDALGNKEITLQTLGENRILLQAPGFNNPAQLKYLVGKTAKLTFHIVDDAKKHSDILYLKDSKGREYRIIKKSELDGRNINKAHANFGKNGNPVVNFGLDKSGTAAFAQITADNVGKRLAVIIDEAVITAPLIRESINQGSVEISGDFTLEDVKNLSASLRAGALPVKLEVIEEKLVGSTLGGELIHAGKKSLIIAFICITIFMVVVYGALGLVASIAIIMNIGLVIILLILSGSTLSLAGIAGLVLTVGMVVDSNVLIFERIKEELKINRKSYISAIRIGFDRAFSSIIDSNVTTIIAALLLLWFGDSNIRGFAITLTYGVLISFFSAIFFSKIIIQNFQNKILIYSFPIEKLKNK